MAAACSLPLTSPRVLSCPALTLAVRPLARLRPRAVERHIHRWRRANLVDDERRLRGGSHQPSLDDQPAPDLEGAGSVSERTYVSSSSGDGGGGKSRKGGGARGMLRALSRASPSKSQAAKGTPSRSSSSQPGTSWDPTTPILPRSDFSDSREMREAMTAGRINE